MYIYIYVWFDRCIEGFTLSRNEHFDPETRHVLVEAHLPNTDGRVKLWKIGGGVLRMVLRNTLHRCIASGKRLHNYGKSSLFMSKYQLFRLGPVQVRKLGGYQAGSSIHLNGIFPFTKTIQLLGIPHDYGNPHVLLGYWWSDKIPCFKLDICIDSWILM